MNKKGAPIIKFVIFILASLIVGAMLLVTFPQFIHSLMSNAEEQIIAKDIGLTIMTVSASPHDVVYKYDKNTEAYEIRIGSNKVSVKSSQGSGEYEFMPMEGITVKSASFENVMIIPITLKNGVISFEDENVEYTDFCANIPQTFGDNVLKVKITVDSAESTLSATKLEEIKSVMQIYATDANSAVRFVDSDEDMEMVLKTSAKKSPEIYYYTNTEEQTDEFSWYRRIACYASQQLKEEKNLGTAKTTESSEQKITVDLGNTDALIELFSKEPRASFRIAEDLYDSLNLGVTK